MLLRPLIGLFGLTLTVSALADVHSEPRMLRPANHEIRQATKAQVAEGVIRRREEEETWSRFSRRNEGRLSPRQSSCMSGWSSRSAGESMYHAYV